ncbi:hypothetical protein CGH21_11795 [Vibrio parahaemolyticus]|nr:hypothetical protein [Vibrio parahaemolyticus]EGR2693374.1 hypothetical protein [Vibrio parahaemolyticus]EGR2708734.1 hypothetical protein [Vibrio parahaemolyticus]EGU9319509.1 hypothetical protein [Vibrio parahaemolyticus]TOD55538.1 hypothetical protein CGJ62_19260 [Vibrio parahaemolyticus]
MCVSLASIRLNHHESELKNYDRNKQTQLFERDLGVLTVTAGRNFIR